MTIGLVLAVVVVMVAVFVVWVWVMDRVEERERRELERLCGPPLDDDDVPRHRLRDRR